MTYLEHINGLIRKKVATEALVAFGQNITRGSCLGGLTRGIETGKGGMAINTTNAENSLVGLGFGLMMEKENAIFFMKQLDFLLLGIDQLVNTYNILQSAWDKKDLGSFTIFPIIVDNGYQGPQSSLNTFADFCTISKIRGYTITNKYDAEQIIQNHLVRQGVRLITVSQRLFKENLIEPPKPLWIAPDDSVFHYAEGSKATIVSFNLAFPEALTLWKKLDEKKVSADLFSVNSPARFDTKKILASVQKTGKLILIDDSKSENLPGNILLSQISSAPKVHTITRALGKNWLYPNDDIFKVNYDEIVKEIIQS